MNTNEISDLIQAIEDKKTELDEAQFKVNYLPTIINQLEKELFQKIQGRINTYDND